MKPPHDVKVAAALLLVFLPGFVAAAPDATPGTTAASVLPESGAAPDPVDGNTVLNIRRRHIQEQDYRVSRSVEAGDRSGKLNVHVGGALSASRINVVILNMVGRVRFHASLKRVREALDHHPAATSYGENQSAASPAAATIAPISAGLSTTTHGGQSP